MAKKTNKKFFNLHAITVITILAGFVFIGASCPPDQNDNGQEPIPTPEPVVAERSYQEWIELITEQEPYLCEGNLPEGLGSGFQKYETTNGELVIVLCYAAAYQSSYVALYSDDGQNYRILSCPEFLMDNPSEAYDNVAPTELTFDPEINTFLSYTKGRGMGDCGSSGEYLWNDASQSVEMIEYRMKPECDGEYQEEWPLIFPK